MFSKFGKASSVRRFGAVRCEGQVKYSGTRGSEIMSIHSMFQIAETVMGINGNSELHLCVHNMFANLTPSNKDGKGIWSLIILFILLY